MKINELYEMFQNNKKAFVAELKKASCVELDLWQNYQESMEAGNEYLDVRHSPDDVKEFAECLKEQGIKTFTYSSTYTGAVEDIFKFQQCGYRMVKAVKVIAPWKTNFDGSVATLSAVLMTECK